MREVILDGLIDSGKVLIVVFLFNILLSFIEDKMTKVMKNNKWSPLIGATFGLVPQCGFSVVASDMYIKQHITMGTLLAVFISCSDEALPILLSEPSKAIMILPLLSTKFILAFVAGYSLDLITRNKAKKVDDIDKNTIHIGCCHHKIGTNEESPWREHFLHPLIHSLKIFVYILVINIGFGMLLFYIGEENVMVFLSSNKYFSPLFATLIGLIPNCASSVILTNLYILNGIPFGACLAGLICNAGLGTMYLFKSQKTMKDGLIILGVLTGISLIVGYLFVFIGI